MRGRKHFPTFVLTFLLKGGLYQRMLLGRFFRDLEEARKNLEDLEEAVWPSG